jgi:hypothetical protein
VRSRQEELSWSRESAVFIYNGAGQGQARMAPVTREGFRVHSRSEEGPPDSSSSCLVFPSANRFPSTVPFTRSH